MSLKEKISNKNIIFFSVQTFNLEKEILKKLQELGANVDYYDERPSNSNFSKGIIRLKRSIYQHRIDNYYQKILDNVINKKYDFLFVNRGEVIPEFFLEKFREIQKECVFIFYTWDSFTNHNHPINILKYFDKKFTFDPDDALKYSIQLRPLFYLDSYKQKSSNDKTNISNDLLFLGTAHSDRYRIGNEIVKWCDANNLKSFCYYYIHGKLVYFYKKLFDKTFKEFDYRKLDFKSLTSDEILDLYSKSNVILDINHPGQKGLTMRTFESVGAQKKMITTNTEIKKYYFYNPKNIYIIDRNNIQLDKRFFEGEYEKIDKDLYESMSIEGWLKEIFVDQQPNVWINHAK